MTILNEQWKPVKGYEGYYKVSNIGRVKSLDRCVTIRGNVIQHRKGKILSSHINHKGYVEVFLSKEGRGQTLTVHRLVAESFIPNPNNYPQVNHKDENKQNNCVDNLEWCTNHYNEHYGTRSQRQAKSLTNGKNSKPIKQMLNGSIIKVWPSMAEAGRHGFDEGNVSACCRGKIKTAYGYQWQYA